MAEGNKKLAAVNEPTYGRAELIEAASAFDTTPHVVAGALRLAGKDEMTRSEAEKAIKTFLSREV